MFNCGVLRKFSMLCIDDCMMVVLIVLVDVLMILVGLWVKELCFYGCDF